MILQLKLTSINKAKVSTNKEKVITLNYPALSQQEFEHYYQGTCNQEDLMLHQLLMGQLSMFSIAHESK